MFGRGGWLVFGAVALGGCGAPEPCVDGQWVWADGDGDGFGAGDASRWTCAPEPGESTVNTDCDDALADTYPGAPERCDQRDNDCNHLADDGMPLVPFHHDDDGDGFGDPASTADLCGAPDASWVTDATDCDDEDPTVFPEAVEVCNGADDDCDGYRDDQDESVDPASLATFYADADHDGFGDPYAPLAACDAPEDYVEDATDCNDGNRLINPYGLEVCDTLDNDCDLQIDDEDASVDPGSQHPHYTDADGDGHGDPNTAVYVCRPDPTLGVPLGDDCDDTDPRYFRDQGWYADLDGDGWGGGPEVAFQCTPPSDALLPLELGLDCDDGNPLVNRGATELCNGIDDDCDGFADDADPSVDPATFVAYHYDVDGDGYGRPTADALQCAPGLGVVVDGTDCNDTDPLVHPTAVEVCNGWDDDCDLRPDGFDDSVDPATELLFYADVDGDGHGDPDDAVLECVPTPDHPASLGDDCDDRDPRSSVEQPWLFDADGDGVGAGAEVTVACLDPGPGLAPSSAGEDCDDADDTVFPGALDPCDDAVDADCSGTAECASCAEWLAGFADSPSGVYTIEPSVGLFADVYCDMTTDGGGWTLVASSTTPLDDAGSFPVHADLTTLTPAASHPTVWQGMRDVVLGVSDIRFACKNDVSADAFDVDLSFYATPWYREISTGTDAQSCFNENNGAGAGAPPDRRDNVSGKALAADNRWDAGYLEGEDSCADGGDFTVDFDDRGMDSDELDGTDWGSDDGVAKCGDTRTGAAYFVFVRE